MSEFIDSHSHLSDQRLDSPGDELRKSWLEQARSRGITWHLQGGMGPEDWQRQRDLQKLFPEILPVYGLHPYWVAAHDQEECEEALNQLALQQGPCLALGEMGLDFRPHIAGDSKLSNQERQITCFEAQLELASAAHKPVVLHVVRAFAEALRVLEMWGVPPRGGFVHSFNGSGAEAAEYLKLGLLISVGGPAARKGNQRLHQALREVPLESLLLETDCPDQPGDVFHGQLNPPESLWAVAEAVAHIKKISPEEILDISSQNLRKLLHL